MWPRAETKEPHRSIFIFHKFTAPVRTSQTRSSAWNMSSSELHSLGKNLIGTSDGCSSTSTRRAGETAGSQRSGHRLSSRSCRRTCTTSARCKKNAVNLERPGGEGRTTVVLTKNGAEDLQDGANTEIEIYRSLPLVRLSPSGNRKMRKLCESGVKPTAPSDLRLLFFRTRQTESLVLAARVSGTHYHHQD